jgi:hypothetical protein
MWQTELAWEVGLDMEWEATTATVNNSVLWIRFGFTADTDPDPAFHLNVDPDLGCKTNTVACGSGSRSWSDFEVKQLNFYMKNILKVGNRSKYIHTKVVL